jgi:hypothetical protein
MTWWGYFNSHPLSASFSSTPWPFLLLADPLLEVKGQVAGVCGGPYVDVEEKRA